MYYIERQSEDKWERVCTGITERTDAFYVCKCVSAYDPTSTYRVRSGKSKWYSMSYLNGEQITESTVVA